MKGNAVPDDLNPLERDLQLFDRLSKHSRDPRIRQFAATQAKWIRYFQQLEPVLSKAAKKLGIDAMCAKLSSEEIAFYIALPEHGNESNIRRMLRKELVEPSQERLGKLPGWNSEKFLTFCCLVFNYALTQEYAARRLKNENPDGQAIRKLLVEEKSCGDLLAKLGREVSRGLFFPGESPGKSEEAPAEAICKIWERASKFTHVTPVAFDPTARLAFMEGHLNKILQQARDHVRTQIETENRRRAFVNNHSTTPIQQTKEQKVLVEMIPDLSRSDNNEHRVLVEQLLSDPEVKPRDKELVKLCFLQGRTQEVAASLLGMSQGAVSKRLTIVRARLKKRALQSPILTGEPSQT